MVNESGVSAVHGKHARTLTTDFPIEGTLDHLVQRIVGVVPISAAGATLVRSSPSMIAHFRSAFAAGRTDLSAQHVEIAGAVPIDRNGERPVGELTVTDLDGGRGGSMTSIE